MISCSNIMHHLFIVFITFLYMFRATLCSSSGGFILYIQHLVLCMSLFLASPLTACALQENPAHIPSVFLLFIGENFWDQLGTNFLYAQFEGQNFVDVLAIQIQHTTDHSDCQSSIRPHEISHFGHIVDRF